MDDKQRTALSLLTVALEMATDSGLFDTTEFADIHPDTINGFCDGVTDLWAAECVKVYKFRYERAKP
jgi:hypothetical protein